MRMPAQQSNAKNYCFTLNNYTAQDEDRIAQLAENDRVAYVLYGREVGENQTPHLQGFISFHRKTRFNAAKALLGGNPHLEVARNVGASIAYCKKDGDYVEHGTPPGGAGSRSDLDAFKDAVKGGLLSLKEIRELHSDVYARCTRFCIEYVADNYPKRAPEEFPLRPWQQELFQLLVLAPCSRKVIFVVDEVGNSGKSWFAHWYSHHNENCQVMLPGKKADMAYALESGLRVFFLDAPRSKQGEFIQYDFLEDLKNGFVFSTKYESRVKTYDKLHVIVNMNEMPDMEKLSADRYHIIQASR